METFKTPESVSQDEDPRKDIRGDVILGVRDPRKMTEKEFITSPEALFHGYNRDYFKYRPEYDYDSDEYFENTEGSATLGQGLYVTDSFAEAAKYSHTRTSKSKLEMPAGFDPSVEIFLPYKAKMLDLRLNSDPNKNGHVPVQFAEFWKKYYDSFYNRIKEIIASENIKNGKEIIPDSIYSTYKNYNKVMQEAINLTLSTGGA